MRAFVIVLLAGLLSLCAAHADAECLIGLYGDQAGTVSVVSPSLFLPFDIYMLLWDEAAVEGVSYSLTIPPGLVLTGAWFSPDEDGFELVTPGGSIVGFGECVIGFGGLTIQVARLEALVTDLGQVSYQHVELAGNPDENPAAPEYATCGGQVIPCPNVQNLLISEVFPVESKSFGAVKSLF